jgi:hypothetical protein
MFRNIAYQPIDWTGDELAGFSTADVVLEAIEMYEKQLERDAWHEHTNKFKMIALREAKRDISANNKLN